MNTQLKVTWALRKKISLGLMVILKNSPHFYYIHLFTRQTLQHLEFIKPQVRTTLPRRTLQKYVIWHFKKTKLSDANTILKNRLGGLITSLEGARSHPLCSKKCPLYLNISTFNFAATTFSHIPSLSISKPHLISFVFLLHN